MIITKIKDNMIKSLIGIIIPLLIPLVIGFYQLWRIDYLIYWFLLFSLFWVGTVWVLKYRSRTKTRLISLQSDALAPEPFWNTDDSKVWEKVIHSARGIENSTEPIHHVDELKTLFYNLAMMVATNYNKDSHKPLHEVRVRDFLFFIEQTTREFREDFVEKVPLHNSITVNTYVKLFQKKELVEFFLELRRLSGFLISPQTSLVSELVKLITRSYFRSFTADSTQYIIANLYLGAGKHLINLYGHYSIDHYLIERNQLHDEQLPETPVPQCGHLRILIVGQVNAGKSSLINALFGETVALSHELPETSDFNYYKKELPGIGKAVLIDSPGYDWGDNEKKYLRKLDRELLESDLVLLVSAADNAARDSDLKLMSHLEMLKDKVDFLPPILVVLSKIDTLRPLKSWNPPYDFIEPENHEQEQDRIKAENIRLCLMAVSKELHCDQASIIPFSTLMTNDDDDVGYFADFLAIALQEVLPEAQKILLRRLLKKSKSIIYWEEIGSSVRETGKFLTRMAGRTINKQFSQKGPIDHR